MPTKPTPKSLRSKRASASKEARSATSPGPDADVSPAKSPARKSSRAQRRSSASKTTAKRGKRTPAAAVSDDSEDEQDDGSEDAYQDDEDGDEVASEAYDSDALDDYEDLKDSSGSKKRKRTSRSPVKKASAKSTRKKRKVEEEEEDDGEEEEELELKEGQEIVGEVVQAPKTGRVPPGQVSKNTFDFLTKLADPKCNDREWFKLNELVYRQAEKEWKDFVEHFTDPLIEVDSQIPHLPPKDVIHRIYRDIRFSNDKTPYKRNFSATFSRSGRKGIFAVYHISIRPGGESLIAAGSWCPGKNELATIRSNILRNSSRLRTVISAPDFVKYFGKPQPKEDGERRNIFGSEDELKVAPKGIDKTHKDIDLLKCRSFVVVHRFLDSEVLSPDFKNKLAEVAGIMQPLVHCLNDMMTIQDNNDDDDDDDD